jgi:hypothetical protein
MARAEDLFEMVVQGGASEVLSFIAKEFTEELFLDYKRSSDNGSGIKLSNDDRKNLSRAISGFGNSEGGVIVWGVDCRPVPERGDVPSAPVKIENPNRFKSWLEQMTSGLTIPPHSGVRHYAIAEGFVVTLIPGGLHAPYQSTTDQSYYIRSGSNFTRTPHAVLAGLFGRRPQPSIRHTYFVPDQPKILELGVVQTELGVSLRNYGKGIAEDIFINLSITSYPGRLCEIRFKPSEEKDVWWGRLAFGREMQLIMRAGYRLPPEAYLLALTLEVKLQEPITEDFAFEGLCGSSGGEPWKFEFRSPRSEIIAAIRSMDKISTEVNGTAIANSEFNRKFFADVPGA